MLTVYIFIIALFLWPSTHMVITYCRSPEQKPRKREIVGIAVCTLGVAVYLVWLMRMNYFF